MTDLLVPGQIFARRYQVERFLAKGGMGAVFVAKHIHTEAQVAIKVLWPHVLASEDAVEKFRMEAKVAALVASEHIVQTLDADYDEKTKMPFLVMELLSGSSLDELVEREGPLESQQVINYMSQIAAGLDKAHEYKKADGTRRPIIHRDLKPENLFVTRRDTGEPHIKILDFGIAKVMSDTGSVSQDIKATPLFMAYEQAGGDKTTPKTDIWAFGLVAFFLLTGKHYWKSALAPDAQIYAILNEVLYEEIVSPSERARELGVEPSWSELFDAWFMRCVDRDPEQRFESAGAAAIALRQALLGGELAYASTRPSVPSPSTVVSSAADKKKKPLARPAGTTTSGETPWSQAISTSKVRSRNRLFLKILGLGTAATLALLFGLKLWNSEKNRVPASTDQAQPSALPETAKSSTVLITLEGAPKGAKIFYDNVLMLTNPFHVAASDETVRLRVEAMGFKPFYTYLVPSRDRSVSVSLKPIPAGREYPEKLTTRTKRNASTETQNRSGKRSKMNSKTVDLTHTRKSKPNKFRLKRGKDGAEFIEEFE